MIRKIILAAVLAASVGSIAIPEAAAQGVRRAPPPPRSEAVPEARPGYVWVPGHWGYNDRRHQWVKGRWVRDRAGYNYNHPTWVERDGRWYMERGEWRSADDEAPRRVLTPRRLDRD